MNRWIRRRLARLARRLADDLDPPTGPSRGAGAPLDEETALRRRWSVWNAPARLNRTQRAALEEHRRRWTNDA